MRILSWDTGRFGSAWTARKIFINPEVWALLRASAFGNIRIMVLLVTCIEEYREAKALVEELKKELDEKGIAYKKDIQVGIMVETAAASLIADLFAKEVDFFEAIRNQRPDPVHHERGPRQQEGVSLSVFHL